ncbi:hypothetical protein TAL182_PC00389 (plasmid) [Rhizobium sp. TAL182]|nr:hypothetical protein TAL182_PC00389 [Rhizobium sp. TAL182]
MSLTTNSLLCCLHEQIGGMPTAWQLQSCRPGLFRHWLRLTTEPVSIVSGPDSEEMLEGYSKDREQAIKLKR